MSNIRLKITNDDLQKLKGFVNNSLPNENGAFALAGIQENSNNTNILVRRPINIPHSLIKEQNSLHLHVSSKAINGLISLCQANSLGAIICHSHPTDTFYSKSDNDGESRLAISLHEYLPKHYPVASLLFTPNHIYGRLWKNNNTSPKPINEIVSIGNSIEFLSGQNGKSINQIIYDRQIRAFGKLGQKLISKISVSIVGVGGTGSCVAEQLCRLGVNQITLIDPDTISPSNLTRVFGSNHFSFIGNKYFPKFKVDIVRFNLNKINPKCKIISENSSIVTEKSARLVLDSDVIFLCTDEHWGRSIINQISYQYLIPVINVGVRIDSENGYITAASGSLDILKPGNPCLWCKNFLRADRIAAESLEKNERNKRYFDGYIEDLDEPAPSVISFTSTVASNAVSVFLNLFTGYMGKNGNIQRINYDFLSGLSRRGNTPIEENCICNQVKGFGDLKYLPLIN